MKFFLYIFIFFLSIIFIFIWVLTAPSFESRDLEWKSGVSKDRLYVHVDKLTSFDGSRNSRNSKSLQDASNYISGEFKKSGCELELQSYEIDSQEFVNIICSFGPIDAPRTIIGAHYDTHYNETPGADDNASGVAAIIELAHLLGEDNRKKNKRIDFIAYTLEELPHFKTEQMGSMVHAKAMKEQGIEIERMISVEMIGYFSDEVGSQTYPFPGMKYFYSDKGDFIAVIARTFDRKIVRYTKSHLKNGSDIPVYSLNAPNAIAGISFSDHASYWHYGFPAVMVTDTSFMRNPHYHELSDTIDTLDFERMADVVSGLYYLTQASFE